MTILESIKKHRISLLLFVLIFAGIQFLAIHFRGVAADISTKSFEPYQKNGELYKKIIKNGNLSDIQMTKAMEALTVAEGHKLHHQTIALNTYSFRYKTVTMLMICSIAVAVFLVFITPIGWNNIRDPLKVFYLLIVAHSVFYGASSIVYGQESTLNENVKQYITFDNIQKELITDVVSFQLADSIAKDSLTRKLNLTISKTHEKIKNANEVKFKLKEYKVESIEDYLPKETPSVE